MRFPTVAALTALLLSCAVVSRAADAPSTRGGSVPSSTPMDVAKRKLDEIEKSLRAPLKSGEASPAELAESCRKSFTVTAMAAAVHGWMVQGSPQRGVLTGPGQFPAFSRKTLGEVVPLVQHYQTCLARVTGQRVCEPMELLGLPSDSTARGQCGDPAVSPIKDYDDQFVFAVATGNRAAARVQCEQLMAASRDVPPQSPGEVCEAVIAHFGDPAAACQSVEAKSQGRATPELERKCLVGVGMMMGDAKTCAALSGEDKSDCERHARIRQGKETPASLTRADPTCEKPIEKLRSWYCGRFSWPVFARLSAKDRREAREAAAGERADLRGRARTELKEVNDLLAEVVNAEQMGPLSDEQKERLQSLTERRDRVAQLLNDGRAPAPGKGRGKR